MPVSEASKVIPIPVGSPVNKLLVMVISAASAPTIMPE